MINRDFFKGEFDKLIQQFGPKFSQRKEDLIYLSVRFLDESELAHIFDEIIGNAKFAPSVQDFRDKARSYNKDNFQKTDCSLCSGDGIVTVFAKATGASHAFSCTCKNGRLYPAFMKWGEQDKKYFTRLSSLIIDLSGKKDCYGDKPKRYKEYTQKYFPHILRKESL